MIFEKLLPHIVVFGKRRGDLKLRNFHTKYENRKLREKSFKFRSGS